jgi:hypothetical protein
VCIKKDAVRIKKAQKALVTRGQKIVVDGLWGKKSLAALNAVQKKSKRAVTKCLTEGEYRFLTKKKRPVTKKKTKTVKKKTKTKATKPPQKEKKSIGHHIVKHGMTGVNHALHGVGTVAKHVNKGFDWAFGVVMKPVKYVAKKAAKIPTGGGKTVGDHASAAWKKADAKYDISGKASRAMKAVSDGATKLMKKNAAWQAKYGISEELANKGLKGLGHTAMAAMNVVPVLKVGSVGVVATKGAIRGAQAVGKVSLKAGAKAAGTVSVKTKVAAAYKGSKQALKIAAEKKKLAKFNKVTEKSKSEVPGLKKKVAGQSDELDMNGWTAKTFDLSNKRNELESAINQFRRKFDDLHSSTTDFVPGSDAATAFYKQSAKELKVFERQYAALLKQADMNLPSLRKEFIDTKAALQKTREQTLKASQAYQKKLSKVGKTRMREEHLWKQANPTHRYGAGWEESTEAFRKAMKDRGLTDDVLKKMDPEDVYKAEESVRKALQDAHWKRVSSKLDDAELKALRTKEAGSPKANIALQAAKRKFELIELTRSKMLADLPYAAAKAKTGAEARRLIKNRLDEWIKASQKRIADDKLLPEKLQFKNNPGAKEAMKKNIAFMKSLQLVKANRDFAAFTRVSSKGDKQLLFSFRGTDPTQLRDLATDVLLATNRKKIARMDKAIEFVDEVKRMKQFSNLEGGQVSMVKSCVFVI